MALVSSNKTLAELENLKHRFGNNDAKIQRAVRVLSKSRLTDSVSLIRFHETLLFLRAYPPSARVLNQVEEILKSFGQRVSQLREVDVDLSPLDEPEVSGIAGTTVTSNFSYAIVRWLVEKYPKQVSIDWDWFEEEDRFGATMPRFLPLLEEDAMVEAHVPYRDWLRAAKGRANELVWLIQRFESLKISDGAKSELYDSLKLHVTWKFRFRVSRTGMKLPTRKIFFHRAPLIQRRDIWLAAELASPPIAVERLSRTTGETILDMACETSAVRYRELHGFTYGEARRVLKANLGRGTEVFVMGVSPEHRLPLRAYHAALIFKNVVPVAYFEGLSIFERMESGFNLYYTFREGETAWLYARILRLMRQLLGVTVFSIDPYQVGHENEEGIESGAFWFYRKLGFRPVQPELMKLAISEEHKMAADPRHRTSARTLRKLAGGHMLFEMPTSEDYSKRFLPLPLGEGRGEGVSAEPKRHIISTARVPVVPLPSPLPKGEGVSEWSRFEVRNLGLAVQRCMARDFHGDAGRIRAESIKFVRDSLGIRIQGWRAEELRTLENFALVLAMIPGIEQWNSNEKQMVERIIRAKARNDEASYLHLMQKHTRLRRGIIMLGST